MVSALDWGEALDLEDRGVTVHVTAAHHWSARGTRDRRMALWGGFVIETPAGKVFVRRRYRLSWRQQLPRAGRSSMASFRLAILPIGAYEPRWFMEAQHQNPEEAVEGMLLGNAAFAAGCHWGTFQLTNEPIDEPRERLLAALQAAGLPATRFRPMLPGEVWDVPEAPWTWPG